MGVAGGMPPQVRQLRKLDVSRTRFLRHIPLGECHMLSTLIARDCPWLGYRNGVHPEKKLEKTQARRLQRRTSKDLVPAGLSLLQTTSASFRLQSFRISGFRLYER